MTKYKPPFDERQYLDYKKGAVMLGCSVAVFYKIAKEDEAFPVAIKLPGYSKRWKRSELKAWLLEKLKAE
tara:strand:+ start:517 stop:726 length:210 start_codon:yes stop_codon:yes gene_type:complete